MAFVKNLLDLLAEHGGKIVRVDDLDSREIDQARESNRIVFDKVTSGIAWIPDILKFPETEEELDFFEKWYPLQEEVSDELTKKLFDRIDKLK